VKPSVNALGLGAAALGWIGRPAAAWSSLAVAALAFGYGRCALSYRPALDS
jgi:hypothetical protein